MRKLLFRVWDPNTDRMIDTNVGIDKIGLYDFDGDGITEQEGLVIMQWTGLLDRNGKEIYEGDILLIYGDQELDYGFSFEWNENAVVCWGEEECGFYLDAIKKREVNLGEEGYFTVDTFPLRKWSEFEWGIEYEVIGNIHENPQLLGGTADAR